MTSPLTSRSQVADGSMPPVLPFSRAHAQVAYATATRLMPDEAAARRVVGEVLASAPVTAAAAPDNADQVRSFVVRAAVVEHRARPGTAADIQALLPQFVADGHHARRRAGSPTATGDVRGAIGKLPVEHRLVLLLHDVEGLALAVTATCLGIDVVVARTRLHQARLALCELLSAAS